MVVFELMTLGTDNYLSIFAFIIFKANFMFLESMTAQEVLKTYKNEEDAVERTMSRLEKECQKLVLKQRFFPFFYPKNFKTKNKNEYLAVLTAPSKKEISISLLFTYMSKRSRVYMIREPEDWLNSFDSHLIKRYRERVQLPDEIPTDYVIAIMLSRIWLHIRVYCKEIDENRTDYVYACKDGLLLCSTDEKKKIVRIKTFVSNDMLQPTQRLAKEKVDAYFPEDELSSDIDLEALQRTVVMDSTIAEEIYSKYAGEAAEYIELLKTEDEETNLNFTLKKGKNVIEAKPSKFTLPINQNVPEILKVICEGFKVVECVVRTGVLDCYTIKGDKYYKGMIFSIGFIVEESAVFFDRKHIGPNEKLKDYLNTLTQAKVKSMASN